MFVELLEKLRCPNLHDDSPLVATASRTVDRHIIEGTLGCPVCHAEYPVHDGAVEIGERVPVWPPSAGAPSPEKMIRLGALLGLDERGGLYVLDFVSALFISELAELSPASQFIALSGSSEVAGAAMVIRGRGPVLPLAKGSARGIALDTTTPALLDSAVQVLATGGRLVAPADAIVPDGIELLARDDSGWVGERAAVPVLSAIARAPRDQLPR
jgi:uncharacterized protein YbaR (Trm112 family)